MNQKNKLYFLITTIITLLVATNTIATATEDDNNLNIICSNAFLADFTTQLLTNINTTIDYLMPSGVCPAQYDTTPSDISKIITADIIISLGSPTMESWLSDLLEYNPNNTHLILGYQGEWNLPANAQNYVLTLKDSLTQILSYHTTTIQTNTQNYLNLINTTAQKLQTIIAENNTVGTKIVCMQWQQDFLEWLNLNVTATYGPPQTLSVQDKLTIATTASQSDVYAIIDNLQSGTAFGAQIAAETGVSHIIFTNFPQAIPNTDTYLDMITYNTKQLIQGIHTYDYKQGEIQQLTTTISSLETQRNTTLLIAIIFAILTILLYILYKKK